MNTSKGRQNRLSTESAKIGSAPSPNGLICERVGVGRPTLAGGLTPSQIQSTALAPGDDPTSGVVQCQVQTKYSRTDVHVVRAAAIVAVPVAS